MAKISGDSRHPCLFYLISIGMNSSTFSKVATKSVLATVVAKYRRETAVE